MQKVFMFVPAFGQHLTAATFMCSHSIHQHLTQKGIGFSVATLSFPDIAELRSMALTIWYDSMPDTEYMLFVDSDMGFQPDMITDMILFGEPLVGAIYPQRNVPVSWAGSGTGEATTERRGNFMLVEGVGMGCTLIHRSLVTKMIEKFPELIDNRIEMQPYYKILQGANCNRLLRFFDKMDIKERGWVSEDLSFCIRWRSMGGQVWAAIGYHISHVGPYDYGACYLNHTQQESAKADLMQQQINAAIAAQQQAMVGVTQVTVPTRVAEHLQDIVTAPIYAPAGIMELPPEHALSYEDLRKISNGHTESKPAPKKRGRKPKVQPEAHGAP